MATQAASAFIQKTCRGGDGKSPNAPTAQPVSTLVKVVGRFEMRPNSANVRKVLESCFIRLTSCSPARDAASRDGRSARFLIVSRRFAHPTQLSRDSFSEVGNL